MQPQNNCRKLCSHSELSPFPSSQFSHCHEKLDEEPDWHFSKGDIQMVNKYVKKRCSISVVIRERQFQTNDISINSHLLEWLLSKVQKITNVGKDLDKRVPLHTIGGDVN